VVEFLKEKGIGTARLEWKGYGETQPLADNETEEGRAANRRIEFKIL
jgi:outer membrane protein OmpA-like peptidoglycan-associated protein